MPNLPWVVVGTTTGPVLINNTITYPVTKEEFSLWTFSCSTPGMTYTFNTDLCNARYQAVEAFGTLAVIFSLLAVGFGIMPFSPVAPREPKQALTHSMLCQMLAGLFALIAWTVFYGGLVNGVFQYPNSIISSGWTNYVLVTYGGIVSVSGWVGSFAAWVLSLSAMIKYDSGAAEQAVIDHRNKKQEKKRRKAEIIERLGEGAARAAREGIALELGDKLYLGGTIAAGATSAVAWAINGVSPYLLQNTAALPSTTGASIIINIIACTVGAIVLLMGLSDLVPRPKASIGGFAVFSVSTVIWIVSFGMGVHYLRQGPNIVLAYFATLGALGIGFSFAATIVLYHPFKIWESVMAELPRPAKIHRGVNGMALANTAAVSSLIGFGLACAAVTIYFLTQTAFIGEPQSTFAPTSSGTFCLGTLGAVCNVGNEAQQCCIAPLECTETAFTKFTCVDPSATFNFVNIRDSYSVAQAFLALAIGSGMIAYIFAAIAVAPNGVMDVKIALSVVFSLALCSFACGFITFWVLQGLVLDRGMSGMPRECGYLLGSWVCELVTATCAFFAWWPYHVNSTEGGGEGSHDELFESQKRTEIERLKLEAVKFIIERIALERKIKLLGGEDDGGGGNGMLQNRDQQYHSGHSSEDEDESKTTMDMMVDAV